MASLQVKQWLRQGIAAAKAGDAERAKDLLLQVVDADEYNEQAWLWLSSVVDSDADREVCLENVLAINPDNNLAKAGLVHLRRRRAPAPPLAPEPSPPTPEPLTEPPLAVAQAGTDWWDQSQPSAADDVLDERLAVAAAPAAEKIEADVKAEKKPKRRRRRSRLYRLVRAFAVIVVLGLGILVVGVGVMAVLKTGPFDPTGRNYATAMRPVLDDYDAWWAGSYGPLIDELDGLCGPTADGWRNRDVLLNCSRYPTMDCARLAAHCGSDISAVQQRIETLSQAALKTAKPLLAALDGVSPPKDIAVPHARLRACIQAQVDDAAWAGELARDGSQPGSDYLPACQMFSMAEEEVRRYVNNW